MKIINCWSNTSKGKIDAGDIVVISRDETGRKIRVISNYDWYFYTDRDSSWYLEELRKKGIIKKFRPGKKYIKVWADKKFYKDKSTQDLILDLHAHGIVTYEADVGPAKRYLLDLDFEIENYNNINVFYFDIETDDSTGKIEYETNGDFTTIKAKDRILSVAFVDKKGEEYFLYDADEKALLNKVNVFLKEKEVDMLVGWNSKDFDIPYLWKRMEHHKIRSSYVRNILHEDMQKRVQYFYSKDPEARQSITSYSLESISQYFLGEGKTKREGKVSDLMKEDFDSFKRYNIQDAVLLKKLEDKLGLIELTYLMFQICHCTAQNWSMVKAIDNFILYEANRNGIHYPTNKSYYERQGEIDPYLGALVLDPIPGYYTDVYDLDFKSLYPNIIRTFNISPDTETAKITGLHLIETPGVEVEGVTKGKIYLAKEEGIIPRKIKLLLEERDKIRKKQKDHPKGSREWKDLNVKQLVVKEIANSIYGVLGNPYFRGFSIDMAEAITATGQHLIQTVKKWYEEKGRTVIYGDTDSVFVKLVDGEDIKTVLEETNEKLSEYLKNTFGVVESTIELALDKKFDKFLIESKKKYVGESEGKLKFVGMESVKRDTIKIAARLQEELILKIFNGEKNIEDWVKKCKESILGGQIEVGDIIIHRKMAKDATSYKGKTDKKKYTAPLHVRIAKELDIVGDKTDLSKGGSIISYVVTGGDPLTGVHISKYNGEYDKEYYWNNLVYPILERVLAVSIPEVDWNQYYILKKKTRKKNEKSTGVGS